MRMTPILSFLLGMVLLLSCAKEEVIDSQYHPPNGLELRGPNKVDICHQRGNNNWVLISTSSSAALSHHINHGDAIDYDGDGYFSAPNACVTSAVDCDDNDPTQNPGAAEICGDGIDNNCDGQIDEGCCPCFTYDEALARAQESATGYFEVACYNIAEGFYDSPINWGIGGPPLHSDWFCVPIAGSCIYEEQEIIQNCLEIVRMVQEVVQVPSCPEHENVSPFTLDTRTEHLNELHN